MIGIVIVTHGRLAEEFVAALEHVVGGQPNVAAICIGADDDMERRRKDIAKAAKRVDDGSGAIILTDMFGGTPSNLALGIMANHRAEVIGGVNLPMLIKLASIRNDVTLEEAAAQVQGAGRKYINIASQVLARETEGRG